MVYAHHSHLFSHEWFALHSELVAKLNRYGLPLGMGTLLATAALFIGKIDSEMDMPLKGAEVIDMATGESSVPTVTTDYLPDQFFEQEKQANIEELPPQF